MIEYFIKSGFCLMALLLMYHVLLKQEKMYHFNRYYLLFALVFSFIAPILNVPFWDELFVHNQAKIPVFIASGSKGVKSAIGLGGESPSYYVGYLLVSSLFLLRFSIRLWKLYKQVRSNDSILYKGKHLVLLNENSLPYTFLNYIFINKTDYQNKEIEEELLTHEMAHVAQKHSLDILFIESLRVLLWWNPLLYFYKKSMALNHEFLADAYVLEKHHGIVHYQELLLNKLATGKALVLSSPFNFIITKRRLKMMTKRTSRSKRRVLSLLTLPLFAVLFFAVANKASAQNHTKENETGIALKDHFFEHAIIVKEQEDGFKVYKSYALLSKEEKKAIPPPPELPNGELKQLPKGTLAFIYNDGRVIIDNNGETPPPPPAPPVLPVKNLKTNEAAPKAPSLPPGI